MLNTLIHATDGLPILCYDTALPIADPTWNRPYRNIADLLIHRSVSVQETLLLSGADRSVINGVASDYESFRALCAVMPQLLGNLSAVCVNEVLLRVFGVSEPLTLTSCDPLWEMLNNAIEETNLTPLDVIEQLGIISVSNRHSPFLPFPDCSEYELSLRPLLDLGNTPEYRMHAPENRYDSYDEFLSAIDDALDAMLAAECPGVCLHLPSSFVFLRNSKKEEIARAYSDCKLGKSLSPEALAALRTSFCVSIAKRVKEAGIHLFLHSDAPEAMLTALYQELKRNDSIPMTVLKTSHSCRSFLVRFAFRSEKGFPGILPLATNLRALAEGFPIGATLLATETARDIVSLAEVHYRRRELDKFLAGFGQDENVLSLGEDIAFANILNRFGM